MPTSQNKYTLVDARVRTTWVGTQRGEDIPQLQSQADRSLPWQDAHRNMPRGKRETVSVHDSRKRRRENEKICGTLTAVDTPHAHGGQLARPAR